MKIELDLRKDINANAATYYQDAKEARAKVAALREARARLQAELASYVKHADAKVAPTVRVKKNVVREWFEKFKWFKTTGGLLCVSGKDAKQNDGLFAHYMTDSDLFFHADIQGAAFTLLKNGVDASSQDKLEAAQWAACNSSAWKRGFTTVDVYSAKKDQLSKASQGEYVGKGAFVIKGQREWFRNTELKVVVGIRAADGAAVGNGAAGEIIVVPKTAASVPTHSAAKLKPQVEISPGEKKGGALEAAKALGLSGTEALEKLMQLMP